VAMGILLESLIEEWVGAKEKIKFEKIIYIIYIFLNTCIKNFKKIYIFPNINDC
jgi:hypothetical protein